MTAEELKEYTDPRRYNLILCLGAGRLEGWFVPYGRKDEAPVQGISTIWTPEPDSTLTQIENAVYDNPALLEDYDVKLLVDTPRQLIFPPLSSEELAATAMKRFYEAEPNDIFTGSLGGGLIAFSLCSGLKHFLSRTFAGVIPSHRLEPLCRWFAKDNSTPGRVRVYADLDNPWMHLLAFDADRLLHASTHQVTTVGDAAYFIFALWKQLGFGMDDGQLNISGDKNMRRELMPLLRRHLNYVGLSLLPRVENADNVPTPVLLAFNR